MLKRFSGARLKLSNVGDDFLVVFNSNQVYNLLVCGADELPVASGYVAWCVASGWWWLAVLPRPRNSGFLFTTIVPSSSWQCRSLDVLAREEFFDLGEALSVFKADARLKVEALRVWTPFLLGAGVRRARLPAFLDVFGSIFNTIKSERPVTVSSILWHLKCNYYTITHRRVILASADGVQNGKFKWTCAKNEEY